MAERGRRGGRAAVIDGAGGGNGRAVAVSPKARALPASYRKAPARRAGK